VSIIYPLLLNGDVIWEFSEDRVVVTKKNPDERKDISISVGDYLLWKRECLLAISEETYICTIRNDGGLILDSKANPRFSRDLPVFYFKRMK